MRRPVQRKKTEKPSNWAKLSDHPWIIALLGAVLGAASTLVGSTVSDWYSQQQYWREERTAAYVAYSASLIDADNAVESLKTSITDAVNRGQPQVDSTMLSNMREHLQDASRALSETVAPVEAIGHDGLYTVTRITYLAQFTRVGQSLWVIDSYLPNTTLTLEIQGRLMGLIDRVYERQPEGFPDYFINASREVMGVD